MNKLISIYAIAMLMFVWGDNKTAQTEEIAVEEVAIDSTTIGTTTDLEDTSAVMVEEVEVEGEPASEE